MNWGGRVGSCLRRNDGMGRRLARGTVGVGLEVGDLAFQGFDALLNAERIEALLGGGGL